MLVFLFTLVAVYADSCPNFTGRFVSERGSYLSIAQNDCTRLDIDRVEVLGGPVVHQAYIADGQRHPVGPYYWLAKWEGAEKLVLEPYAYAEGGEMIGLRTKWSLSVDGSLLEEYFNDDGSLYEAVPYRRRR